MEVKKRKLEVGDSHTPEVFEIDYCGLMNRNLPEEIRVLSWCETSPDFSARFSASFRLYRYFFTAKAFRYFFHAEGSVFPSRRARFFVIFAKMNIAEVSNFRRECVFCQYLLFREDKEDPRRSVFMLEIRGIAFSAWCAVL